MTASLRRIRVLVPLALSLAGCGPQFAKEYGTATDARKMIEVVLPMPVDRATSVVTEAAIRGGWTVGQTSPGVVSLVAYRPPANRMANVTLRANIVGADSARVIVSGTVTNEMAKAMVGAYAEGEPVTEATKGGNKAPWDELTRFAEAIRAAGSGTILPAPPVPPR